jgi:hypothetical protein
MESGSCWPLPSAHAAADANIKPVTVNFFMRHLAAEISEQTGQQLDAPTMDGVLCELEVLIQMISPRSLSPI